MATSTNKLDILKNDIPYSWLNFFKILCSQCSHEFSSFEKENYHRAVLLKCSHVACQICIGRGPLKFYKCRTCNVATNFDATRDIRAQTTFNEYLDGILNFKKHVLPYRQNYMVKSKPVPPSTPIKNKQECFECSSNICLQFCLSCEVIYCQSCFTKIHKAAKALKHHRKKPVDENNKDFTTDTISSFCKIHHNEKLSFYCKDCNESCCMKCSNENHPNHEITSVREENIKHKHKVERILALISASQKENKTSKLKLEDFYSCHGKYLTVTIEKITNHFIYLHGILQNIELEYINTVKQTYKEILDDINSVEATLSENETILSNKCDILHSYKVEIPKDKYILTELQKIEELIRNLPISANFKDLSINPFSFNEVKSIKDEIKSYFELDSKKNIFKELSTSVLQQSNLIVDLTQIENNIKEDVTDISTNTVSTISSMPMNQTTSILNQHFNKKNPINESKMVTKPKVKVLTELVHVSHIKSAAHFYVQNQSFLGQSEHFLEICNREGTSALPPTNVKRNEMYLVYKTKENIYYRGIVTDCTENKNFYTVLYVDYGSTENKIKKERLREISQYLLKHPKAARLCSLYHIQYNAKKLSEQAQIMSDIIRNQQMTMVTLYEKDGAFHVDLFNNNENKISLRDALLFCDVITINVKDTAAADKIKNLEDYKREFIYSKASRKVLHNIFKVGEYFKICIKHIVSPAEFYAMKDDHIELIENMNKKLNEFCMKSPNFIYYPQISTNCAVYGPNNLWHRGLITNILPNNLIEVKLIDVGIKQIVPRHNLMYLDHSFCSISEGVINCQLSEVQPKKEDNYTFSEHIIQKFRELSLSSNLHLNVHKIVNETIVTILHIIQTNQELCVNDLLKGKNEVNYQRDMSLYNNISMKNFDMSLKLNSTSPKEPTSNRSSTNQGIKRSKLIVLNVCSPSEIYICLENALPGLKKIHIQIQKYMETKRNDLKTKLNWMPQEKCFVNTKLDKNLKKQWYRGIIQSVDKNDDNKFLIFLRDKGVFVTEHYKHISDSNDLLDIGCGALQCALACVKPSGGHKTWPSLAIDEFRELVQSFQEHAVSLYGEKFIESGKRKCYNIILWGLSIECEDALSPAEIQWNNINMILSDAGLCHLTQKFTDIEKQVELETEKFANDINEYLHYFENILSKIPELSNILSHNDTVDCQISDSVFCEEFMAIDSWPKCEPIRKSQFIAIPTYVDHDAVIYLHEHDAKTTIDRIKKMINDKYKNSESDSTANSIWTVGQPCIAKYHADNLYYRARIISKKNDDVFQIEFIDYGNIEECNPCDLRRDCILGNVPIQAHKYCLKDIEPITPIWTTQILDIIHSKIVLKICSVRTNWQSYEDEELDVVPCQITVDTMDLSKFLVTQKFAQFKNENIKPALIYERFLSHCHQGKIYNGPSLNRSNVSKIDRSVKDSFATLMNDSSSDVVIIDSGDCSNDSDDEEILSFDDINFETSTQYVQLYEYSPFKMCEIQRDVHGFQGTIMKVLSPTDIIISTKLEKLQTKYKEMMDTLQLKALTCENLKNIAIGLSCIAWNQNDNFWHRGLIKAYNQTNEVFKVLLVDKMDMISVKSNQIKKCPSGCQNYPLLYLRVTLSKVKPNRRLRESDIINELSALLLWKTLYVKILKIKSQIPIVELYKDNKCEILVYQSVIDRKFLCTQ